MKQEEQELPVKMYGKGELASFYSPNVESKSAVRTLMRWIHRNTELSAKLRETGYDPMRRTFFSAEVALIFNYLGRP
jgi:hypothetical protein